MLNIFDVVRVNHKSFDGIMQSFDGIIQERSVDRYSVYVVVNGKIIDERAWFHETELTFIESDRIVVTDIIREHYATDPEYCDEDEDEED